MVVVVLVAWRVRSTPVAGSSRPGRFGHSCDAAEGGAVSLAAADVAGTATVTLKIHSYIHKDAIQFREPRQEKLDRAPPPPNSLNPGLKP